MRYHHTPIKASILSQLLVREDLVLTLWVGTCRDLGIDVPVSNFYESIYHLRDEGLVQYKSRELTDDKLEQLLNELAEGEMKIHDGDEEAGMVYLTATGRAHAELYSLKELIPPSRLRDGGKANS